MGSDSCGGTYKGAVADLEMLSPSPLSLAARRLSLTARLFSSSPMAPRAFLPLPCLLPVPPHRPPQSSLPVSSVLPIPSVGSG